MRDTGLSFGDAKNKLRFEFEVPSLPKIENIDNNEYELNLCNLRKEDKKEIVFPLDTKKMQIDLDGGVKGITTSSGRL